MNGSPGMVPLLDAPVRSSSNALLEVSRRLELRFLVLDSQGTILEAGGTWSPGALSVFELPPESAGAPAMWRFVLDGVRDVLAQRAREFNVAYDGASPDDGRRFAVRVQPTADAGARAILVVMDITEFAGMNRWATRNMRDAAMPSVTIAEAAWAAARANVKSQARRIRRLTHRIESARISERKRIARELHDDVCQRLAAVEILCTALTKRLGEPSSMRALEEITERVAELSRDIRALTREMRGRLVMGDQLALRVRSYVAEVSRVADLHVDVEVANLPATIPMPIAVSLYRVAQEGLRNVAKHAGTDYARVRLIGEGGGIGIQVEDRGIGFDAVVLNGSGSGIAGLTERITEMDGEFDVNSSPGEGTRVRAWIPVTHP